MVAPDSPQSSNSCATSVRNNQALFRLQDIWKKADEMRLGGERSALDDRQRLVERAKLYLRKLPPAVSGQHGHDQTFHAACVLVKGFGLAVDEAWEAIKPWNNVCRPPWEERDLRRKLEQADQAPDDKPRGYLIGEVQAPAPSAAPAAEASSPKPPSGLQVACMANIEPKPIRYLVPGLIPLGKLVSINGEGGHGKSTLSLHMAAKISRGEPCFNLNYSPAISGEVLLFSCEDDPADTVVPRLLAAGADLQRVHLVEGVPVEGKPTRMFSLADYQQLKFELQRRPAVRLVVIDPAAAYVGRAKVDDHRDSELRGLLGPLSELAAECSVTVLLIMHLNKGVGAKAIHRVNGSVGYTNAVRAAFVVAPDAHDETRKLFLPMKFNLGPKPQGLAYRLCSLTTEAQAAIVGTYANLTDDDRSRLASQLVRIEWDREPVTVDADTALGEASQPKSVRLDDRELAEGWLKSCLTQRPVESMKCVEQGNAALSLNKPLKWWRETILKDRLGGAPRKTGRPGTAQRWWFTLAKHPWPFPNLEESEEAQEGEETLYGSGSANEDSSSAAPNAIPLLPEESRSTVADSSPSSASSGNRLSGEASPSLTNTHRDSWASSPSSDSSGTVPF
ncbi:MAG: AAA family ATPase [Planctomycetia bacterium]|nr:AAA family ATPase [Planctomycetia bacterium]